METHAVDSHRILRNRPRAAAVIAGVLLVLATANLLMALAGGLGLWTFGIFNLEGMRNISFGLGVWTIAAWTIAGFVGGFGIASRDMVSGIGRRIMLGFFIANLSAFAGTLLGAAFGARRQASLLDAEIEAHGFSAKAGHASGPAEKRL